MQPSTQVLYSPQEYIFQSEPIHAVKILNDESQAKQVRVIPVNQRQLLQKLYFFQWGH